MAGNGILERLVHRPLVADGAMGTLLMARGVPLTRCLEALVVEQPALVTKIHLDYLRVGADIITTHTFGANAMRLAYWGLAAQVSIFNTAAVRLAQAARQELGRVAWIAGNVGPVGRQVQWTDVDDRRAVEGAFAQQIEALAVTGVDLLLFETFSDVVELEVAVGVARSLCNLPIVAAMSFDAEQRTLTGLRVEDAIARMADLGVEVIGANCSVGPAEMVATLARMRAVAPDARLYAAPNAGLPIDGDGGMLHYPVGADEFAAYAAQYVRIGASIVGGCCGTTPDYVRAMRGVVDEIATL